MITNTAVDVAAARASLQHFLLADPHAYLLKLVQHAVAAGARAIEIESKGGLTRVVHNGRLPQRQELSGLFGHLAPGGYAHSSLSPLALGVHSALEMPKAEVRVIASGKDEGWKTQIRADSSLAVEDCRPSGAQGLTVEIRTGGRWWPTGDTPEGRLVRDRCGYAPVPLKLNGRAVAPAAFGDANKAGAVDRLLRSTKIEYYDDNAARKVMSLPKMHHAMEARFESREEGGPRIGLPVRSEATLELRTRWSTNERPPAMGQRGEPSPWRAAIALCVDGSRDGDVRLLSNGVQVGVLQMTDMQWWGVDGIVALDDNLVDHTGLAVKPEANHRVRTSIEVNTLGLFEFLRRHWRGNDDGERVAHLLTKREGAKRLSD